MGSELCQFPAAAANCGVQNITHSSSPNLDTRRVRSRCPRAALPPEAPGEGPSCPFQLLGAPGCLPPVSASVFMGLLLCVCVSPLLSLRRTLSLGVGPPSSRRTSSQTLHFSTSAETLLPHKVPFPGSRHQNPVPLRTTVQAGTALTFLGVPVLGMCS